MYCILICMYVPGCRSYRLAASNTKLREQLDESRLTNSRLNSDVAKLSAQLGETRRNLADREREMEETLKVRKSSLYHCVVNYHAPYFITYFMIHIEHFRQLNQYQLPSMQIS